MHFLFHHDRLYRLLNDHRDGLNHTEGDVLKYFDWDDVSATGEIALNVVKHVTT